MTQLQDWFHKYNAWSFTKHRLWKQCRRAYYYQYIAPALQDIGYSKRQKLKHLKNLNPRFVLQGKLVHDILEKQIAKHHTNGDMREDKAKEQYIQLVEDYRGKAQINLVEYFNGEPVNEAFFDRIRENGLDQIGLFFGVIWIQFAHLQYLRHEEFDRFNAGTVEAIVKVDYASKTHDNEIIISDWKTGADNEEYENDLQLAGYVLWAMQFYGANPDKIRSQLVYLTTGSIKTYSFSTEQLKNVEQLIISDFEEMNKFYDMAHFEPTPEPKRCLRCRFSTVCNHSRANELINR